MSSTPDSMTATMEQATRTYFDACQALAERPADASKLAAVRKAHDMAMSYVWGWQDRVEGSGDSDDALAFAAVYALHTADFEAGTCAFRRPIVEAFRRWRAGDRVRN